MKPDDDAPLDLSTLARSSDPPSELEARVVGSLRARGLLQPATTIRAVAWRRYGLAVLAAAAILAIGFVLGARSVRTSHADGSRYLLLLYQDSAEAGATLGERDSIVAEYVRWAGGLREEGRLVLGEELGEEMAIVPQGERVDEAVSRYALGGFFVVRAVDLAHAVEIARSTPHAHRGGAVVVRRINPT